MSQYRFIKNWTHAIDGVRSQRYFEGQLIDLPADIAAKAVKAKAAIDANATVKVEPDPAATKEPGKASAA